MTPRAELLSLLEFQSRTGLSLPMAAIVFLADEVPLLLSAIRIVFEILYVPPFNQIVWPGAIESIAA